MIAKKNSIDCWFKIEPYVHISMTESRVLLYNTLDGIYIETDKIEVIELLREILQKENSGVVLLTPEKYNQQDINNFISELREKYMGDVIGLDLSKGKPVQILPYYNLQDTRELFKKHNFTSGKKLLNYLSEVTIHVDNETNITHLISFLQSLPVNVTINIVGNLEKVTNYRVLLSFLNQLSSLKNIILPYTNIIFLRLTLKMLSCIL